MYANVIQKYAKYLKVFIIIKSADIYVCVIYYIH